MSGLATPLTHASPGNAWQKTGMTERGSGHQNDGSKRVELRAKQMLENHPHFRGRSQCVNCCCSDDCLYLEGTLPTYYLKQSAQEALSKLSGIKRIVNLIQVTGPAGCFVSPNEKITVRKAR